MGDRSSCPADTTTQPSLEARQVSTPLMSVAFADLPSFNHQHLSAPSWVLCWVLASLGPRAVGVAVQLVSDLTLWLLSMFLHRAQAARPLMVAKTWSWASTDVNTIVGGADSLLPAVTEFTGVDTAITQTSRQMRRYH